MSALEVVKLSLGTILLPKNQSQKALIVLAFGSIFLFDINEESNQLSNNYQNTITVLPVITTLIIPEEEDLILLNENHSKVPIRIQVQDTHDLRRIVKYLKDVDADKA